MLLKVPMVIAQSLILGLDVSGDPYPLGLGSDVGVSTEFLTSAALIEADGAVDGMLAPTYIVPLLDVEHLPDPL